MQFNTSSNIPTWTDPQDDIVSDIYFWTGTNSLTYKIADIVRNCNRALDKLVTLIHRSDSQWKWSDNNNSDLDISTTNLVANQEDYSIPTTQLKIHKVRIKDRDGNWVSLAPVNRNELTDSQLTASAGDPKRYDKIGNSYFLYPKSNYSSSGGFEVQHQRGASYFATTDTTKEPGVPSQFHRLVPLYASRDYGFLNSRKQDAENLIKELELELLEFMSQRGGDERPSISLQNDDYGENSLDDGGYSSNPDGF